MAALVLEGGHDYLKLIRGSLSFPFPSTPGLTLTLSLLARVDQGSPRNEASSTVGRIEDIGATDGEKLLPRPGGSVVPNLELPLVQIAQAGVGRNANEPALVPLRGGGLGCSESISGGRCTRCRRAAPAAWGAWRPPSGLESGTWAFRERDDWTRLRTSHKGGSVHSFACLPSPLPWYPLPPLSGYPFCPGGGGPSSPPTSQLPPLAHSCVGGPFAGESVASKSGPAGAAWEDRLRSPRHPAPGDCLRLPSYQRATRGMSAMSPPAADLIRAPIMEERAAKGP